MKPINLSSIGHLSATFQMPVAKIRAVVAELGIQESLLNDVSHFNAADVAKIRDAIQTDSPNNRNGKAMATLTAKQRLKALQMAKKCVPEHPDHIAERVSESVVAMCGGDWGKIEAAFENHTSASVKNRSSLVQSVWNKRRSK